MQNKKQITQEIIRAIGATVAIGALLIFPNIGQLVKWAAVLLDDNTKARRGVYDLRRRGLIKTKKIKTGIKVILTKKGNRRLAVYEKLSIIIRKQTTWDGLWRIVIFDISDNSTRDSIRKIFKKTGFVCIQKSVFIQPYPCFEIIQRLRSLYHLEPGSLYVFETRALEGEDILKQYFRLA